MKRLPSHDSSVQGGDSVILSPSPDESNQNTDSAPTFSGGSNQPITFKFAVNREGKDKNWDFELLTTRYRDVEGTIEDVKREVGQGYALCAGLLGGKRKSKANVIGSQWILIDVDNSSVQKDEFGQPVKGEDGKPIKIYDPQLTLESALNHPFVRRYCALLYTTPNHRADWHKFRLVFLLPEYVQGADTVEICTRFLMQHLPHDPVCKDASRVFYGNSRAEFPLLQPSVTLPLDWVVEARQTAERERIEHARRSKEIEERGYQLRERATAEGWNTDVLIQEALSYVPQRSPGSNNYEECRNVLFALHDYYGPEKAEAVAERWSPSIRGNDWNIPRMFRRFKGSGVKIGTLFHIAKQYGFRFPKKEFSGEIRQEAEKGTGGETKMLNEEWSGIPEISQKATRRIEEKVSDPDERLRLELLALLKETDPIRKTRKRAEVCSNYRLSKPEVEDLLKTLSRRTEQEETKVYRLDELLALESEGVEWIIPELLPKGETVLLVGSPKAGKTLLAIDAAFAIATGEGSFLGESVKQGKVLLVSCDESLSSTRGKLIKRGFRDCDKDFLRILPRWTIDNLSALEEQLEDFRPDLVIIDSLKRITVGSPISENSAEFGDNIYLLKETLTRYKAGGILVHHANKSNDAMGVNKVRGSSTIPAATWGTWQVDHIPKPDPNNSKKLIIDPKDPRRVLSLFVRGTEGQTIGMEFNPEDNSWIRLDEETKAEQQTVRERILNVLEKNSFVPGLAGRQIIELLGMNREEGRGIYTELNRMVNKQLLSCKPAPGDKRISLYSLPQTQQVTQQGGDSPPPPPSVKVVEYSRESIDKYSISDTQQNTQQILNNYSTTSSVEYPVEYLKLSGGNTPGDTQQLFEKQGGEGGVPVVSEIQCESKEILSTGIVKEEPIDDILNREIGFDAQANAQLMIEVLEEPEAYEMLTSLLDEWTKEEKAAVRSHLTSEQVEAMRVILRGGSAIAPVATTEAPKLPIETQNVNGKLEGCDVPLIIGSKVRCYPSSKHWQNEWAVTATITAVQSDSGYFAGCEVRYFDFKAKQHRTAFIGGGSSNWILKTV
jgi:hypothetical protein